jgi:hypothetical protein
MTPRTPFHAQTPLQALLREQALLLAQQLETAASTNSQNPRTHLLGVCR